MTNQTAGGAIGQEVAQHIDGIIIGVQAGTGVKGHVQRVEGNLPLDLHTADGGLLGLLRQTTRLHLTEGNGGKPLLRQAHDFVERDVASDGQHGIVGGIVTVVEIFHFVQCGLGNMAQFQPDGRPPVRVHLVGHAPHQMASIAVGLVQMALLELFHHNATLHLETFGREGQPQHAV